MLAIYAASDLARVLTGDPEALVARVRGLVAPPDAGTQILWRTTRSYGSDGLFKGVSICATGTSAANSGAV